MVKNENLAGLPILNVGIVGHIDHGKTTLLQKLSGKWASTHSEELKRGITIKLGYADIILYNDNGKYNREGKGVPARKISFIDAPGHEMLTATMLTGASLIDAAILVVAANEGIKPQTREHLAALKAKKIKSLIVVQNKIDLVEKEKALKNFEDIKELLKDKFENVQVIPVSAQQGVNLDVIYKAIAEIQMPERETNGEPLFIVARSFDINKPGTKPAELKGAVLGGILKRGRLKVGDKITILPGKAIKDERGYKYSELKTTIKGLFLGSEPVTELTPGGSSSILTGLDMALGKSDALAGNAVYLESAQRKVSNMISLKINLFKEVIGLEKPILSAPVHAGETIMLSVNSSTTGGNVQSIKNNIANVSLKIPIVPEKGNIAGIARNIGGHWRLIGCGELI